MALIGYVSAVTALIPSWRGAERAADGVTEAREAQSGGLGHGGAQDQGAQETPQKSQKTRLFAGGFSQIALILQAVLGLTPGAAPAEAESAAGETASDTATQEALGSEMPLFTTLSLAQSAAVNPASGGYSVLGLAAVTAPSESAAASRGIELFL
ncbi:MAG: hypothetical protein AB7U46_14660 [Paenirhodobacter sp.]|uniref:hypothetical protein n=1 Tax=Paenirhodobacter sp. TaxID=1965326 RepID=UPI003D0F997D